VGDIIVGGKKYPVLGPVKLWTATGLEATPIRGARRRRRSIDLGVWHWTGGEGDAHTLFMVLRKKGYGVEFYINQLGVIYQFCDPRLVDTFDAGKVNDRSFGVEIANYGFKWGKKRTIPKKGVARPTYTCELQGRRRRFAHFYPPQIAAGLSLANAMSEACSIPREVPTSGGGYWVDPDTMDEDRLDKFKGHVGHFHIKDSKSDPGLDLLGAFRSSWAARL